MIPLTARGRLSSCILLSFRTPAAAARPLIPPPLEPITRTARGTDWAFFNVVLCRVEKMRPAGLPRALGLSYHHIAYRLMVHAPGADLRGLYFLRSDADHPLIARAGNVLSDFRFHPARITLAHDADAVAYTARTRAREADADVHTRTAPPAAFAPGSIFSSLDEARAFLKYQPLGLSPARNHSAIRLAEVSRDAAAWRESPITVEHARLAWLDAHAHPDTALELATLVEPIEYTWRLGTTVTHHGGTESTE